MAKTRQARPAPPAGGTKRRKANTPGLADSYPYYLAGRPVAANADLASFWQNAYPQARPELRGRYPKHAWPEDPWTAPPTRGTGRNRAT